MTRRILTSAAALLFGALLHAQQPVADVIVSNAKVITVGGRVVWDTAGDTSTR